MKHIIIAVLVLVCNGVYAQGLGPGDVVPDVEIKRIYGYDKTKASLTELMGGKPALMIFWSSTCGTCRKFLPEIEKLDKLYGKKMRVLMVTSDKQERFMEFRRENPVASRLKVVSVAADTLLRAMLGYIMVPHVAWVSAERKVLAITGKDEVTTINLDKLIAGELKDLAIKKDPHNTGEFLAKDPIMLYNYPEKKEGIIQYSYLSGYRNDIAAIQAKEKLPNGSVRVVCGNCSVSNLYIQTYPGLYPFHHSQLFFPDSALYSFDYASKEGLYCYDLIVHTVGTDSAYRHMRKDLDNFFGLTSYTTKKEVSCYALKRSNYEDKLASKSEKTRTSIADGETRITKMTIGGIIQFNLNELPYKVIDETGYKGNVDIVLPENRNDIALLRGYLERYGLTLTEEKRLTDVIVIEKRK